MTKLLLSKEERCIVDIFDPGKREYRMPETLPFDFIIDNRLCFSLYNKVGSELESKFNPDELERVRRKAKSMEYSVNELRAVAKAFEENGINYAFIFKALTSQCDSTDVDTVVEDAQVEKAGEVLESFGYYAPLSIYKNKYLKSKGSVEVVQIEIDSEEKIKSGFYFLDEEKKKTRIFESKKRVNGVFVPCPEKDLAICVLKLIHKRRIALGNIIHIASVLENCHDINYLEKCVKKEWFTPMFHYIYVINILYKCLFDKNIKSPLVSIAEKKHRKSRMLRFLAKLETKKINFPFRSRILLFFWYFYKLLNLRHLYNFKEEMQRTLSHYFPPYHYIKVILSARKKNMLISFSGIDGTGKTTQITKLVNRFRGMMIPAQSGRGLWSPKISYPLMGVLYLLKGWRRKDYQKSRILRKIWNYIVILDFLWIYFFNIKKHLLVGKTVFCDRYVYDLIATLMHDGLYNEQASRVLLKLAPQPDLAFVLDIPAEVSDSRKDDTQGWLDEREVGESALEYLKIMRENFMRISKSLDIPIVDATREVNEIHEELFNKSFETYKNKNKGVKRTRIKE